MPRLVAIMLVRNEERFLDQAIANIHPHCDEVIIADSGSVDDTWKIASTWSQKPRVQAVRIDHPAASHDLIRPYFGTDTWIFAVDGDEIYDPEGLQRVRECIELERWNSHWMVIGHCIHVVGFKQDSGLARGFMSPPSRSITKLYNCASIDDWSDVKEERLHGGKIHFRPGFSDRSRLDLRSKETWDEASLRCLHMCFLQRSRADRIRDGAAARWNIADQNRWGPSIFYFFQKIRINQWPLVRSAMKSDKYRRGPCVEVSTRPFFEDPAFTNEQT